MKKPAESGMHLARNSFQLALRLRAGVGPNRVKQTDCTLDDRAPAPRAGPFLENDAAVAAIVQSGEKDLVGCFVAAGQREGQRIKAVRVIPKDCAKVLG